jgi:hypothetical protein
MTLMKHLRGHSRRYFTFAAIAMHSTLHCIAGREIISRHHTLPHRIQEYGTSPPEES